MNELRDALHEAFTAADPDRQALVQNLLTQGPDAESSGLARKFRETNNEFALTEAEKRKVRIQRRARAEVEAEEAEACAAPVRASLTDGASFVLDVPEKQPAVWGDGGEILWAQGQALMLCGGNGVGKTTLGGQLLRGRLGLTEKVLGLPVAPGTRNVLYLACDRPSQIARSLSRQFVGADRETLRDRLVIHKGPPPYDLAKRPEILLAMCEEADADTVIIDSLKDVAVGLAADEVAAGYNRARQIAIAAGVEILENHHQVKRSASGGKPEGIEDVYGGAFLTGGAGSVILLAGDPGDPIVRLKHLKPVIDTVGPLDVQHDHDTGLSTVIDRVDLIQLTQAAGIAGLTARDAARRIFEKDPSKAQVEKTRRRLDRLTASGHLTRVEPEDAGRGRPAVWYPNSPM
ncbi:AAA family ATPase [Streptomyces cinnamoneus]